MIGLFRKKKEVESESNKKEKKLLEADEILMVI